MSLNDEKTRLRQEIRLRLKTMTEDEKRRQSAEVCSALAAVEAVRSARTVLAYAALKSECSLSSLCESLTARGCTVAYPRCNEDGTFSAYAPLGELKAGKYGILEPDPAESVLIAPDAIDVALVPAMCFDLSLGRLGKGGGYYDRYLPLTRALKIGVAFDCQIEPLLPRDGHDIRMDMVVTPRKVFL